MSTQTDAADTFRMVREDVERRCQERSMKTVVLSIRAGRHTAIRWEGWFPRGRQPWLVGYKGRPGSSMND